MCPDLAIISPLFCGGGEWYEDLCLRRSDAFAGAMPSQESCLPSIVFVMSYASPGGTPFITTSIAIIIIIVTIVIVIIINVLSILIISIQARRAFRQAESKHNKTR